MSVKLLHPDVGKLFAENIEKLSRAIELGESVRGWTAEKLSRLPTDHFDKIAVARKDVSTYQSFLVNHKVWSNSESQPGLIELPGESAQNLLHKRVLGRVFLYKNAFYAVAGPYSQEEAELVLIEYVRRQRRKVEYLTARKDLPESELEFQRHTILEDVRHEVWRRDRGRCAKCGSVRNLEFDHIVPVSRGGGNTARNVQLLCEGCNREKSNIIG